MKKYNALFWVIYLVLRILPIYGIIMGIFFQELLSFWTVFFPIIFIGAPAVFYVMSLKCNNCGKHIYTTDHINNVKTGFRKFPPGVYADCPECHAPIE